MSEGAWRLALAMFIVLAGAVSVNIVLLQPVPAGNGTAVARGFSGGSKSETAALPGASHESRQTVASKPTPPASAPAKGTQRGPSDEAQAVQLALVARGYETGGTDGEVTPVTRAAILAYEVDHGLPLTAEPTKALAKAILEGGNARIVEPVPASSVPGPKAEHLIRTVQAALTRLGYLKGVADGRLNAATIGGIRQFEKQQGMPDTGRVSGELVVRLSRLAGDALGSNDP